MSAVDENEFIESLVWSDKDYSLKDFVATFPLPQIVRVEVGFCAMDERTSLASDQVLMLHFVEKTKKLVGETPFKNAVVIPLDCPLGVLVQPWTSECQYSKMSTRQLPSLCGHVKYVLTLEGFVNAKSLKKSWDIDEILEIMDVGDSLIKFQNLATGITVAIPLDSDVLFAPLLDFRRYTVAEVIETYGLPTRVRFPATRRGVSSSDSSAMLVSSLGEVTLLDEIEQAVVVATTVGDVEPQYKTCVRVPHDFPVQVAAAQASTHAKDEQYRRIVEVLDGQFNESGLAVNSPQNLDIYEDIDAVKKTISEKSLCFMFERPSDEVQRRLPEFRSKEFGYGPAPPLPPKEVDTNETSPPPVSSKPPSSPKPSTYPKPPSSPKPSTYPKPSSSPKPSTYPKPSSPKPSTYPKPSSSPKPPSSPKSIRPKPDPKPAHKTLPKPGQKPSTFKSLSPPGFGERPTAKTPSVDELGYVRMDQGKTFEPGKRALELDSEYDYAYIRPFTSVENIYEEPDKLSELPKLDKEPSYLTSAQPSYSATVRSSSQTVRGHDVIETMTESEKQVAYSKIDKQQVLSAVTAQNNPPMAAPFPQDLSALTVTQVGEALCALCMECYVKVFEEEFVDGEMLKNLDRESLESLGMTAFHLKKLMMFIDGWRPNV